MYLRSRYYEPDLGRFMTRDAFPGNTSNPLSMHKYAYVENNPVNWVDPLGFNKKDNKVFYGPPNPKDIYGPPNPFLGTGTLDNWHSLHGYSQGKGKPKTWDQRLGAAMNNLNDKYIAGPLNKIAKKTPQAVENFLSKSPLYNLNEAISGKSIILGDLTPQQRQAKADLFSGQMNSGIVSLGVSGLKTSGPLWPGSAAAMDEFLGVSGTKIPDGRYLGRNKVIWQPSDNVKIIFEEHPYHQNAPDWHKGPHWHLDTPGSEHVRYLPGDPIP